MTYKATVSFRAECPFDVESLTTALESSRLKFKEGVVEENEDNGEVLCELQIAFPVFKLVDVIRDLSDSQVMLETLREVPYLDNNMTRSYQDFPPVEPLLGQQWVTPPPVGDPRCEGLYRASQGRVGILDSYFNSGDE